MIVACGTDPKDDEPEDEAPADACDLCPDGYACVGADLCVADLGVVDIPPEKFARGGDTLFVSNRDAGTVWAVPLEGGEPVEIGQTDTYLDSVAANDTRVFWSDSDGSVHAADHDGGGQEVVATVTDACWELTADDAYLYCARRDYDNRDSQNGLARIPVDGGDAEMLTDGDTPDAVIVDDDRVYLAFFNAARIGWVPTAGGGFTKLDGDIQSDRMVLGGDSLFATGNISTESAIYRVYTDGSGSEAVLPDASVVGAVSTGLYYLDGGSLFLAESPFTSGEEVLGGELGDFVGAGTDGTNLFLAVEDVGGFRIYQLLMW